MLVSKASYATVFAVFHQLKSLTRKITERYTKWKN